MSTINGDAVDRTLAIFYLHTTVAVGPEKVFALCRNVIPPPFKQMNDGGAVLSKMRVVLGACNAQQYCENGGLDY